MAARPYIRGDSLRRVHWVHTARRDTLIVCERQTASRRSILVVLDHDAFSCDEAALDWSLRIVASLCREFHTHACDLTCELNGERLFVSPAMAGLHRLLDRLAAFEPKAPAESTVQMGGPNATDRLTILVTSAERWQLLGTRGSGLRRSGVRAVVIDGSTAAAAPGASKGVDAPILSASRAWISLTLADEPSRQLQQQWERQCHADWAT